MQEEFINEWRLFSAIDLEPLVLVKWQNYPRKVSRESQMKWLYSNYYSTIWMPLLPVLMILDENFSALTKNLVYIDITPPPLIVHHDNTKALY